MQTIVPSLKLLGDLDTADESTSEMLARRAVQRRQLLTMTGLSYAIDAFSLALYGFAGTTGFITAPLYLACTLLTVACFAVLSDAHFNDRFKDHYLVVQQMVVSFLLLLAFTYMLPEVGSVFICSLFVTVAFGSLRATIRQIALTWTGVTMGLALLLLLTDTPITIPHGTPLERFATLFMLAVTLGRCMMVGLFSSVLRESFYNRGLALKEAYQRIEELAELDELTGSYNRRSIMQTLREEMERSVISKAPCSLALIDLDFFKRINDRFGHPIGDEALRTFAITLFANIRSIDRLGRYGGEEFLLLLPGTNGEEALKLLDRLRLIVADIDWDSIAEGVMVTMSAGVVALQRDETADSVLARADAALYRAKEQGRNRVERG
jgi:diguanylate cyclase